MNQPAWPPEGLSLAQIMEELPQNITTEQLNGITATVQLRSTGRDAGEWSIVVKSGECTVTPGPATSPDLSIEATSDVWASLISKKLDAGWAYMSGQLRVNGDVSLAMRLQALLPF